MKLPQKGLVLTFASLYYALYFPLRYILFTISWRNGWKAWDTGVMPPPTHNERIARRIAELMGFPTSSLLQPFRRHLKATNSLDFWVHIGASIVNGLIWGFVIALIFLFLQQVWSRHFPKGKGAEQE